MKPFQWFRIGFRFRRWLTGAIIGAGFLAAGFLTLLSGVSIHPLRLAMAVALILAGVVSFALCMNAILTKMLNVYPKGIYKKPLSVGEIGDVLFRRKSLDAGPKITVIGGGTGISTMLRGLKQHTSNLTAIITVADDGGGSGALRNDLGMLPPGDIRNCLMALAETESVMETLMQYRFTEGMLKGQSFGNLFLAAMNGVSGSFDQAVRNMSNVLAVTGSVLPVTEENVRLVAELEDGTKINGESNIGMNPHPGRIHRVMLDRSGVQPQHDVLQAILEADLVILGPGSLYTSIIPNLLVDGVCDALQQTRALKLYVANIMTQPGESMGYTVGDHVKALVDHGVTGLVHCLVNCGSVPDEVMGKYRADRADIVRIDSSRLKKMGMKWMESDLVSIRNGLVRHDPDKLARAVMLFLKANH